jgi:hypothetical protein
LRQDLAAARAAGEPVRIKSLETGLRNNRRAAFNHRVDAVVTVMFLALIVVLVSLSLREWWRLVRGLREPQLSETPPVWLPEAAVAEGRPVGWWGYLALALLAAREVSGEAACDRAQQQAACACRPPQDAVSPGGGKSRGEIVAQHLEKRYGRGMSRCC